jgi:bifunctional UDP-N-acetylglucosamine pyrophosphorylase/glucosamine-1-phosphate N-acetyltransferase
MNERTFLSIVLAAGEGTRMRSRLPKVLHQVSGRSMLAHVLTAVKDAGGTHAAVVIGPDHDPVSTEAKRVMPAAETFIQHERRGTAHAVLAAHRALARGADDVLIIFGDTPLIRPHTLARMRAALREAAVVVLGFRPSDPEGYGRLLLDGDQLLAIREQAEASEAERAVGLCNAGLMAFQGDHALAILEQIGDANRKGEFYLTDAVAIARSMGLRSVVIEAAEEEVSGINTKAQLAAAEAVSQQRLRKAAMDNGITLVAPETVFLSADTALARDVVIEPFVVFGPGVTVEEGAVIHAFSHLAGAHVGKHASVGPYARLRPGARLGEKSRIGNFVEVKESVIEAGAKANHLAYIGDAHIGADANIGAGTITCNYDGSAKHRTEVGNGAFIGTNSSLVAPVKIGEGAYIGSGSVITEDVPADALALGRARQFVKEGWAQRLRALRLSSKKNAKSA